MLAARSTNVACFRLAGEPVGRDRTLHALAPSSPAGPTARVVGLA